jgi:hypothetical protein
VNKARASVQTSLDSLSTHSRFLAAFCSNRTTVPRANPLTEARIVSSMMPVTKNSFAGLAEVIIATGRSQYGVPIPSLIPDSSWSSASSQRGGARSLPVADLECREGHGAVCQLGVQRATISCTSANTPFTTEAASTGSVGLRVSALNLALDIGGLTQDKQQ